MCLSHPIAVNIWAAFGVNSNRPYPAIWAVYRQRICAVMGLSRRCCGCRVKPWLIVSATLVNAQ
jgi:hypothetical protein